MPLQFSGYNTRTTRYQAEVEAPLGDVLGATARESFSSLPIPSLARFGELTTALNSGNQIDADTARKRITDSGLDGRLKVPDTGIASSALDIMIDRKKNEIQREEVLARSPSGFGAGAAKLSTGLAVGMLDPINVGLAFVPVVGEARYLRYLAGARGVLGRTVVRAGVGAVEGAAGAALTEPLTYAAKTQEQADYDFQDSLINVGMGTLFGGGLHTVAGGVADAVHAGRGTQASYATLRGLNTDEDVALVMNLRREMDRGMDRRDVARVLQDYSPEARKAILGRLPGVDTAAATIDAAPLEVREQALRTAVSQAIQGREVDVSPIIKLEPGAGIPRADILSSGEREIERAFANQLGANKEAAFRQYADVPDSEGGRILNTDLARELSADYRADRTRSAAVHEPASWLVKQMYAKALKEGPELISEHAEPGKPFVVFRAGNREGLKNANAGDADSVAGFLMRLDDRDSPQPVGSEKTDHVYVYAVTHGGEFGQYTRYSRGKLELGGAAPDTVGRTKGKHGVVYSFPEGAKFKADTKLRFSVEEIRAELERRTGHKSFDDAGSKEIATTLRDMAQERLKGKVLFTGGGTGAGKSTAIALLGKLKDEAQIIFDTNLNSLKSASTKIDQALNAGKNVSIVYVWRDPTESLTKGALPRAMRMGRTVPVTEHANTHVGGAKTIKELAEKYRDDPRVTIQVIDNSHGKGGARLGSVDQIPDLEYNAVLGELNAALEAEHQAGRISDAVYAGTAGLEKRAGAQGLEREAGAANGGKSQQERAGRQVADARTIADRQATPDSDLQSDTNASRAADEQLAAEPAGDDPVALAKADLNDTLTDLKQTAAIAGDEDIMTQLESADAAVANAEIYAKAARAAVLCGLGH